MTQNNLSKTYSKKELFVFGVIIVVIAINLSSLLDLAGKSLNPVTADLDVQPGYGFYDFKNLLKDTDTVGYLTDKNMTPEKNDGAFLQAQYFFAPVVLDLHNPYREYLIIDCESLLRGHYLASRFKASILRVNEYGKILAKRKLP